MELFRVGRSLPVVLIAASCCHGQPTQYRARVIGLTGDDHTDGWYRTTYPSQIVDEGFVLGHSENFTDGSRSRWLYDPRERATRRIPLSGYSSAIGLSEDGLFAWGSDWYADSSGSYSAGWLHDARSGMTHRLGFYDGVHVSATGRRVSQVHTWRDSPTASGYSIQFGGGDSWIGTSAWVFDRGSGETIRVGLTDGIYALPNGIQDSYVWGTNAAGQATGRSAWFNGAAWGSTAWVYSLASRQHTQVGPSGALFTGADGSSNAMPRTLTNDGALLGTSSLFVGDANGRAAWIYRPECNCTALIELADAVHIRSDGIRDYDVDYHNPRDGRWFWGIAARYAGGAPAGQSVWLFDRLTDETAIASPQDAEHTRGDGYAWADTRAVNAAGQAIGYAHRFAGDIARGQSAWFFDPQTGAARIVGLRDVQHTRSDGARFSDPHWQSLLPVAQSPVFYGISTRYQGVNEAGESTWCFDARTGETIRMGLFDLRHTSAGGTQQSRVQRTSKRGQIAGYSTRYAGSTEVGESAWFFDPLSQTTTPLVFSERADGYARTYIHGLNDGGQVVGAFLRYDADGSSSPVGYLWSLQTGLVEVADAVVELGGDYPAIDAAVGINAAGEIIAVGRVDGVTNDSLLLIPDSPCLADWQRDGRVDASDLVEFLHVWFAQSGNEASLGNGADYSGDGRVDVFDLLRFLDDWFIALDALCP